MLLCTKRKLVISIYHFKKRKEQANGAAAALRYFSFLVVAPSQMKEVGRRVVAAKKIYTSNFGTFHVGVVESVERVKFPRSPAFISAALRQMKKRIPFLGEKRKFLVL